MDSIVRKESDMAERLSLSYTTYFFIVSVALMGFYCSVGFSLVVVGADFSLVLVRGHLVVVASLVVEHKL